MLSPKNFASSVATAVLLITLSACATNPQLQLSEVDATCKQARSDAAFLQQLTVAEGNANAYLDAAAPPACKTAKTLSLDSAPRPRTAASAA